MSTERHINIFKAINGLTVNEAKIVIKEVDLELDKISLSYKLDFSEKAFSDWKSSLEHT